MQTVHVETTEELLSLISEHGSLLNITQCAMLHGSSRENVRQAAMRGSLGIVIEVGGVYYVTAGNFMTWQARVSNRRAVA